MNSRCDDHHRHNIWNGLAYPPIGKVRDVESKEVIDRIITANKSSNLREILRSLAPLGPSLMIFGTHQNLLSAPKSRRVLTVAILANKTFP